ncbi:hypothetical protein SEUCBS140593_003728 [Sporothrix eucalyptigena]|uniref:Short chain type dehydrogenase n=1 Tax=Sporothrix eucalyptigena TaxID=1812306 RepID=A0ABP0BHF6_9PEZI
MASPTTTTEPVPQTLFDKVAIVSGSSSGIGRAIAHELSAHGARVVINYPFESLRAEAEVAAEGLPAPHVLVEAGLRTVEGPHRLVDAAVSAFGRVDVLVNNAGVAINLPFEEQTLEHWDDIVNLNGRGMFLLTQSVLPHLTKGSGRIVNIVSVSSRGPPPLQTLYVGSKGMVDSFTRVWAQELPPKYGCTVNAVSPGPVETPAFTSLGPEVMEVLQPNISRTPVAPRMAKPEEIAHAVAFLCEERARWVNGAHLFVNGGLVIQ